MTIEQEINVVIEFGSNTTKVMATPCLAAPDGCFYKIPLRLADSFDTAGNINEEAIEKMVSVISEVKNRFKDAKDYIVIGTEALRRAVNKQEIIERISAEQGMQLWILSPQEEAEAAYLGVRDLIPKRKRAICIDIGGSSTELVKVYGQRVESMHSFPIGAVDLAKRYIRTMPITNCGFSGIRVALEQTLRWKVPSSCNVIASGGSVYTCAMVAKHKAGKPDVGIDGFRLLKGELFRQMQAYRALNLASIAKIPGMDPDRADIILPAVMIMHYILEQTGQPYLIASTRGVRHGVLSIK